MAGLIFTLSILAILATVGFLFAWMVRLASVQETSAAKKSTMRNQDFSSSVDKTNP